MPQNPPAVEPFDRNSDEYRELVEVVASGSAMLFVGAGIGCRVGYPSWGTLLKRLAEAAKNANPGRATEVDAVDGANGLVQASKYREILGDSPYNRELLSAFGPRTPRHDSFHETLVTLPFGHVLTTNYDGILESAHAAVHRSSPDSFDVDEDDWKRLSAFRVGHWAPDHGRQYVHVHGSIGRPQGIVLGKDDYDARYIHETRSKKFLCEILTGQRVVFVGFSLADEDLMYILREVAGSLDLVEPRHFALLPKPVSPAEERSQCENNRKLYGIESVYFDNSSGDFAALDFLVAALAEDVLSERRRHYAQVAEGIAEDIFQDEESREDLTSRLAESLLQRGVVMPLPADAGAGDDSAIDRAIDKAFEWIKKGLPDDAIKKYEEIRDRAATLTSKQRYRIEANIGNALRSKGEMAAAANSYLRAVGHYRESCEARGLELLAYYLEGKMDEVLRLAEPLCKEAPDLALARAMWIRAQPDEVAFADIEAQVPESLRSDTEVALALADQAARTGDAASHERYARAAVAAAPDWADAAVGLACAILASARSGASVDIEKGPVPKNLERVAEAEELLSRAIELVPDTDPGGQLGGYFFNRSQARNLRGDATGAESDLREAFRRDPANATIAIAFAIQAESPADIAAALNALGALQADDSHSDQVRFAQARLLYVRRVGDDLEKAFGLVSDLALRPQEEGPPGMRGEIVRLGLHILSELKRSSDGPAFVSAAPEEVLSPLSRAELQGRAEFLAGDVDKATEHARNAIRLLSDKARWLERRETALLAQDCRLWSEALEAWTSLLGEEATGADTVHLVRCAYFAGEWKTVLRVCDRVRKAGGYRCEHLAVEVEALAGVREPDRAIRLLEEWVKQNPTDKYTRLNLSVLALRHERQDLVEFDESLLPSVSDMQQPDAGTTLVAVLRRGPKPERALEIAYELYRRFPDRSEAQRTLLACVFDPSGPELTIDRPSVVGKGTAAHIRRDGQEPRWVYVEDGESPDVNRGEYPASHELIASIWGKKAGDEFVFQDHHYEVLGVENRILRRVHEVAARFQENFPDGPVIRQYRLPDSPPADATVEEKLGEVMHQLKRDDQSRELLLSAYEKGHISLAALAEFLDRPLFDVVRTLAAQPMATIRSDDGDPRRWTAAIASLKDRPDLILDATALAGALVLGTLDILPQLGFNLLVPQAVFDEIRLLSLVAASPRAPVGTLGMHQGKAFFHPTTLEDMAREAEALDRVLRFIRDHCEVVGGEATLDLPAEIREAMQNQLGEGATASVALARKRNGVLWTDDMWLQALASHSTFGVRSVWTQAVVSASRNAGRISDTEYTQIAGQLVRCGYAFMRLSSREIANLLESSSWRVDNSLGQSLIRLIRDVGMLNLNNRFIVAIAFLHVWLRCPKRDTARDLIASILEGIGRDHGAPDLAALIYRTNSAFSAKLPKVRSLKRMLRSWRTRDGEFRPKTRKAWHIRGYR